MQNAFSRWPAMAVVFVVLLAQASSCCCCLGGAITPPITPFPIDQDQAKAMRERAMQAKATQGAFTITFTDQELTSYLVGLAQSGAGEFPARDVKFEFDDGYVQIWGTFIEMAPTDLPVYVRATIDAANGDVVLHIQQANAGPFPVPGAMRELIAQSLSETLAELNFALEVQQVQVRPGEMTLTGVITGDIPDLPLFVVD